MVKYRCLVHDVLDKEYYNGIVEEVSNIDGSRHSINGKYKDFVDCTHSDSYLDFDSSASKINERYAYLMLKMI